MAPSPARLPLITGAVLGLLGVLLGAFAAHFLKSRLVLNDSIHVWDTALLYQWFHALALLALGQNPRLRRGPVLCWLVGVVLFSGSLYLLALDPIQKWAGPLTPLGGLAFLVGWVWLIALFVRKTD